MRKLITPFFLLAFFCFQPSIRAQTSRPVIDDFRRQVLAIRINEFVSARQDALRECVIQQWSVSELLLKSESLSLPFVHSQDAKLENVLKLMDSYRLIETEMKGTRLTPDCKKRIVAADLRIHDRDRARFRTLGTAAKWTHLQSFWQELDPVCLIHPVADFGGRVDGNPCMAGFDLVSSALKDASSKKISTFDLSSQAADRLVDSLSQKLQGARSGEKVDLTQLVEQSFQVRVEKKRALALLAFMFVSPGSALGFVSPLGDAFWKSPLQLGQDPIYSYNQYMLWLNRKDQFVSQLR